MFLGTDPKSIKANGKSPIGFIPFQLMPWDSAGDKQQDGFGAGFSQELLRCF